MVIISDFHSEDASSILAALNFAFWFCAARPDQLITAQLEAPPHAEESLPTSNKLFRAKSVNE
jgi:hypothetical protein